MMNENARRYNKALNEGMARHREQMLNDGMLSHREDFACLLAPMDTISTQRIGPEDTSSTYIRLVLTVAGQEGSIALSSQNARALAASLMNRADEADPLEPQPTMSADEWMRFGRMLDPHTEVEWDDRRDN